MEEADRLGISAVLTADAELEVGALACGRVSTAVRTSSPTPGLVDRRERRAVDDLLLDVARDDPTLDVVAREADRASE